mmetsp:Transcript_18938/g.23286  ORF Transcript_18938/g.23286 Transcript_18938/m.23286 type:complete len:382 (-) Transcript_18938:373-1518(-)
MEKSHRSSSNHTSSRNHQIILQRRNSRKGKRQSVAKAASISKIASIALILLCHGHDQATHALVQSRDALISKPRSILYYRNYPSEDDNSQQPQHRDQLANQGRSTSLWGQTRNHTGNRHNHTGRGSFVHKLWTRRTEERNEFQKSKEEREKQFVIDNYLESIDRRYKRLHEKEEQADNAGSHAGGFTNALQWLTQTSDSTSLAEEQRKRDDAIYVLGLAELASTRLLQRHHLPIPESKLNKSVVIDMDDILSNQVTNNHIITQVEAISNDMSKDQNGSVGTRVIVVRTMSFLLLQALIIVQTARLRCFAAFSSYLHHILLSTVRRSGKTFGQMMGSFTSFVSTKSGGKYSFQIVSLVAATMFAFVASTARPMTKTSRRSEM